MPAPPLNDDAGLTSDVCLTSVAYIGPRSRIERPRKTKIDTEVAHVTRTPLSRSKVQRSSCRGRDDIVAGGLSHSLLKTVLLSLQATHFFVGIRGSVAHFSELGVTLPISKMS